MKKFLLAILCAFCSLAGMAQTVPFTDKLVVTINGESTAPQDATILFTLNEDFTCDFALNNFMLDGGDGNMMAVGNIKLQGLPLAQDGDFYSFSYDGNLLITQGDLPGYGEDEWLGPLLGEIPLKLTGRVNEQKMIVNIDIDMMESIGQIIYVAFGSEEEEVIPFVDDLVVTINGESTAPQQTTIYLLPTSDDSFTFKLKNFMLDAGDGNAMAVGNIVLPGLQLVPANEDMTCFTFSYDGNLLITQGDLPEYGEDEWLGPLLGEIPLKLEGKVSAMNLYVTIDIDMMESIGQIIHVVFGRDFEAASMFHATYVLNGIELATVDYPAGVDIVYPTMDDMDEMEGFSLVWNQEYTVMPDHDIVINGQLVPNTYTVTYKDADGNVIATFDVPYGTELPEAPEYTPVSDEHHQRTFVEWAGETYDTMPAHDIEFTAVVEVVDAIASVAADGQKATIYDLQGRRVEQAVRGLYIINGKKVLK